MSVEVYKIVVSPAGKNHFGVDRSEVWSIQLDDTFSTKKEAETYVIRKNIDSLTGNVALDIKTFNSNGYDGRREIGLTNPNYLRHRRYFIGKPPIDKIKAALQLY